MSMDNLKKRKRGSRASQLARFLHREGKKYCAVALCASLIAGNLGSSAVAADESDTREFELDRVSLYEALQEAVMADESDILEGTFTFAGEAADTYDILFNSEDNGNLYELKPEIKDNDGALSLRIFARLDGKIEFDSAYELDGTEEMIFLLTNTSKEEKTAVISVDGKRTEEIKVAPKSAVSSKEAARSVSELTGPGVNGEPAEAPDGTVISGGSGSSGGGSGSGGGGGSHSSGSVVESGSSANEEDETSGEAETTDPEQGDIPAAGGDQETGESQENDDPQGGETGENNKTEESADAEENGNQNPEGEGDTTTGGSLTDDTNDNQSEGNDSGASTGDSENGNSEVNGNEDKSEGGSDTSSNGQETSNEVSDNNSSDNTQDDAGEAGNGDGAEGNSVAAVSYHKTYLVAATPSDAEEDEEEVASPSNASDSNADENMLDGMVYDTVLMDGKAVAAFVTTFQDLGIEEETFFDWAGSSKLVWSQTEKLDNVTVTVRARTYDLQPDAELQVTELSADNTETAEQLNTAKATLRKRGVAYDGIVALEGGFVDGDGNALESPKHGVEVSIEMDSDGMSDPVKLNTVEVHQLDESGENLVSSDEMVEVSSGIATAALQLDSISTMAVTYQAAEVSLAAIVGPETVGVGDTIDVSTEISSDEREVREWSSGRWNYRSESWSSSDESVAKVEGIPDDSNGDKQYKQTNATITGVSAGNATITHTYYTRSGWAGLSTETETFTVRVIGYYTVSFDIGEEAQAAGVTVPDPITVKGAETISELPTPEWKDENGYVKIFAGWYTNKNFIDDFTNTTSVTEDMTLYALWVDQNADGMYYVNFYSQDGQTVYLTVSAAEGKLVNPAAGPIEDEKAFKGWSITRQGESPVSALEAFDFKIPVSEQVEAESNTLNLYAWYAPAVKVSFISNGGMSVPTQIIAQGDKAEYVAAERTGYTFTGWSTDPEIYTAFDFNTPVGDNITLYAFWTANMVPVTLVYMYENADDDKYSPAGNDTVNELMGSEIVYAPAGSYVSIQKTEPVREGTTHNVRYSETADGDLNGYAKKTESGSDNAIISDVRSTYYQYDSATNNRQVMPDGSTVVLVYYNRARITLTFTYKLDSNASIDVNGCINKADQEKYGVSYKEETRTVGSGRYQRQYKNFVYSFTAKYGQDITAVWPQVRGWVVSDELANGDKFYTWKCPDEHAQTSNMFTLESSLFVPKKDNNNSDDGLQINVDGVLVGIGGISAVADDAEADWLIYARTSLEGENVDFTYNGQNYTIYADACQCGYSPSETHTFGYKDLDGCTAVKGELTWYKTYQNLTNTNSITVIVDNNTEKTVTTNDSSMKITFDRVFGVGKIAWKDNCQVLLYDRKTVDLTVRTNTGSITDPQTKTYLHGDWIYNDDADLLKQLDNMTKEGYRFAGWYTDPSFIPGTEYDLSEASRIYGNLNLYAKWEPSEFLAEYYLYTDDSDPYATQGFAEGGKIDDKFVPEAVQDQFLGWYWYQNGTTLVRFDFTASVGKAHVDNNGVLKLYAMWKGSTGKVSYLPGAGGDNSTQEVFAKNDTDEVLEFKINDAAVQLPKYTNVWTDVPGDPSLTFVGWEAPNGRIYQPGRYVLVTRQLMQFEAQWSTDAVTLIYKANGGDGKDVTETWERNSEVDIWDNMDGTTPHFTRDGYELIGWDTDKNATEPDYSLGEGTIFLTDNETTLYAIWKRKTVDVTITKQVSGILGDRSKAFEFEVISNNPMQAAENGTDYTLKDKTTATFTIKHGDSVTLKGVEVGSTLTITEPGVEKDGYTMTIEEVAGLTITSKDKESCEVVLTDTVSDDISLTVDNYKTGDVDAGVLLDSLPYVLILAAVAAGVAFFVIRKRREDESDLD